jgi:hypothetical protein
MKAPHRGRTAGYARESYFCYLVIKGMVMRKVRFLGTEQQGCALHSRENSNAKSDTQSPKFFHSGNQFTEKFRDGNDNHLRSFSMRPNRIYFHGVTGFIPLATVVQGKGVTGEMK